MKLFTIIYCIFLFSISADAQVSISNNGAAPSSSSTLDVQSTSRGVKFPRMTTEQRKAIAVTTADAGLMLYDTDESSLYMYDGTQWLPFATASAKQQHLKEREPSGISMNARGGASVGISGEYAAVGCPQDSVSVVQYAGSVLIYKKINGNWLQQSRIVSPDLSGDWFGYSLSISGNILAVGAIHAKVAGVSQGAVYIYINNNGNWVFQQKIYANDGAQGNQFGYSVLLHDNSLYVGSVNHMVSFTGQGSVYVFNYSGNSFVPLTRINGTDAGAGDRFGASLAAHNNTLVIGAPEDANTGQDEGAAYVFLRTGNSFGQQAKIKCPLPESVTSTYFGRAVAILNDMVLVGCPYTNPITGYQSGAVFTYKRTGTTWSSNFSINASSYSFDSPVKNFGSSVIITNSSDILIGAPGESVNGLASKGAIYHYRLNPSGNSETFRYRYYTDDPYPNTGTGTSIAANGSDFIIGSPGYNGINKQGTVFFGLLQ